MKLLIIMLLFTACVTSLQKDKPDKSVNERRNNQTKD